MRGHLAKRAKNTWSIKISLGKDSNTGKYRYKWVTVKGSKKDALRKLSELLHQLDTGGYVIPVRVTVTEYLQRWLKEYAWPNLAPRTAEGYEKIVRRYLIPEFGNLRLVSLRPEHLQQLYTTELTNGLSPQTIRNHHALIHRALGNAVEWGLVARNVADAVKPPRKQHREMQVWSSNEISTFLEKARNTPYYEIFFLALFTGMRRSELLALRWQDIDLILGQIYVNRSVHVTKGSQIHFRTPKTAKGRRTIALTPSTLLTLADYHKNKEAEALLIDKSIDDNSLLFSNDFGETPILPDTVSHAWLKLVKKAGVQTIRLHDARHTHASIMLRQGIHPKVVQERLGHATISTTLDIYSHVAPGLQEQAALRFDEAVTGNYNKSLSSKLVAKPIFQVT